MATKQQLGLNIPLVGDYDTQIFGNKLPSNRQVLKVLYFNMREVKLNLRQSATLVIGEVLVYWKKARLKTKQNYNCIIKLEKLYESHRSVLKNANQSYNKKREAAFSDELDNLFDIAHRDVLETLDAMGIEFLQNQRRPGRVGYICYVESTYDLMEKKEAKRVNDELKRLEQMDKEYSLLNDFVELASSSEGDLSQILSQKSTSTLSNFSSEFNLGNEAGPSNPKKSRGTINLVNDKLVAVLDKCRITDNQAVHLMAAMAQSLHFDLNSLIINRSSIRRAREKLRESKAIRIKSLFQNTDLKAAVLHWDGKLLPDKETRKRLDRLPILITNCGEEKLLGVPKLENGKGVTQANAIYDITNEWGVANEIKALCCDTTAANLGCISGAAALLEKMLEKNILYLPCRHHIFEIILRSVFEIKFKSPSTGPNIPIFERFKEAWSKIDPTKYDSGIEDTEVKNYISNDKVSEVNSFVEKALKNTEPRADYQEFLVLTQLFLGHIPSPKPRLHPPGPTHHARWMAKGIYCLKMYLLRKSLALTETELKAIRDVCIFVVTTYVEAWFTAPLAGAAPYHDLIFLKKLHNYKNIDREIATKTIQKFLNHLWYLNPESVALSFFDKNLPLDVKRNMLTELGHLTTFDENCPKKIVVKCTDLGSFSKKTMDHFVTPQTWNFFLRFGIDHSFLQIDPSLWPENDSYKNGLMIVNNLKVVNDTAERAVCLFEGYNNILTTNEEQKQYILQIVEQYRKQYPDNRKQTVVDGN